MCEKQLVTVSGWYTAYIKIHPGADRREIAGIWHDLMAPAKVDRKGHTRTASMWLPDTRSPFRQEFCKKVLQTAEALREKLRPQIKRVGTVLRSQANIPLFSTAFPVG